MRSFFLLLSSFEKVIYNTLLKLSICSRTNKLSMFITREWISSPRLLNMVKSCSVSNAFSASLVEGRVGGVLSSSSWSSSLSSFSPSITSAMIWSSLEKEEDVTTSLSRSANDQLIDLVEWHHYPTHAISRDSPANFWMDRHHRSLLPVGLIDLVRFLETVNNAFLWYGIPWWDQVFHCLENNNLWEWFVALHCFDTKMNDFLASYYTLVHWLQNRHCIWRQENQIDVLRFLIS